MQAELSAAPDVKRDIQDYWGAVYRSAYAASDAALTPDALNRGLDELEDMFRYRAHLAVTEMPAYGAPWVMVAPFEPWLGRRIGWGWNITAIKRA